MRRSSSFVVSALAALAALALGTTTAPAEGAEPGGTKAWCGPDVQELSDHVCIADGGVGSEGRRTLVVYLHGMLAMTPGFQYVQQNAMALHAKRHHFTVIMPTAPADARAASYAWPTSQTAQSERDAGIFAAIKRARHDAEKRVGHPFDETFVVGFSSGAYYASALAVRGALDVDGYVVLAGGSAWAQRGAGGKRAPIFVGVSAADPQTAGHSRSFAGALAAMGWPFKVEERNAGHMVDATFMAHGMSWLRAQRDARN